VVFARLFAGAAIAEDHPDKNTALSLIAQCKQEAQANSAEDTDTFVRDCIDDRMEHEKDEDE
jgi:hypothetical protein